MGAERGSPSHLSCLQYLMEISGESKEELREELPRILMGILGWFGSVEALRLIDETERNGAGEIRDLVARTTFPDAIISDIDHMGPTKLFEPMLSAIYAENLEAVELLYKKGYNLHRANYPEDHPAYEAVRQGWLAGLQLMVERSGPPEPARLNCSYAVRGGVEMLRYVRELRGVFDARTTQAAALRGDVEALRFVHECGAPWDFQTIEAAVTAGSLPCLEYAHTHGCPSDPPDGERAQAPHCANNLAVLRYVCEHMDPTWAAEVVERTASFLVSEAETNLISVPDWQLVLYLGRKLGPAMPEALAEAVATRKKRAVALAWVFSFWKARRLVIEEERRLLLEKMEVEGVNGNESRKITDADARRQAVWEAMARVPKELRERIALEAHLIIL
jgi:hypothetical protein